MQTGPRIWCFSVNYALIEWNHSKKIFFFFLKAANTRSRRPHRTHTEPFSLVSVPLLHNCLSPASETCWCCFNPPAYPLLMLSRLCVSRSLCIHLQDPPQPLIDSLFSKELLAKSHTGLETCKHTPVRARKALGRWGTHAPNEVDVVSERHFRLGLIREWH